MDKSSVYFLNQQHPFSIIYHTSLSTDKSLLSGKFRGSSKPSSFIATNKWKQTFVFDFVTDDVFVSFLGISLFPERE